MKKSIAICASSLKESYAGFQNLSIGDLTIGLALVAQTHSEENLLKEANENPQCDDTSEWEQMYGDVWERESLVAREREKWVLEFERKMWEELAKEEANGIAESSTASSTVQDTHASTPEVIITSESSSDDATQSTSSPETTSTETPSRRSYVIDVPLSTPSSLETPHNSSHTSTGCNSPMTLSPPQPPPQTSISKYNPHAVSPFLLKTCMHILETAFLPYEAQLMKRQKNILSMELTARHHEPVHIAYVDHAERRIVISIRGTNSINDVFTDFSANAIDFETSRYYMKPTPQNASLLEQKVHGKCHHGMTEAARWILKKLAPELKSTFRKHPHYSILTCGHSLGGASSAILALLLREWCMDPSVHQDLFPEHLPEIKCITFACPAVFSRELSLFCRSFTTTFCVGADIITRLASGQAEILRQEILNSRWKTKVGKWYTEWNETKKPFEKINGFLGKWNLPVIPTQLEWNHSPNTPAGSDVDKSKIFPMYPCGTIYLLTYHDKGVPQGKKTRIVTQKTRPFTIRRVSYQHFSKIILHGNMFHDHRMSNYIEAFEFLCRMSHRYELENNVEIAWRGGKSGIELDSNAQDEQEEPSSIERTLGELVDDVLEEEQVLLKRQVPQPTTDKLDLRAKLRQDEKELKELQEKLRQLQNPSTYLYTSAKLV